MQSGRHFVLLRCVQQNTCQHSVNTQISIMVCKCFAAGHSLATPLRIPGDASSPMYPLLTGNGASAIVQHEHGLQRVTSRPTWCKWKSWLLLLLVLREVKDKDPEGLPSSLTAFHTLEKAPLMRRRALAPRFLPSSALLEVHYLITSRTKSRQAH